MPLHCPGLVLCAELSDVIFPKGRQALSVVLSCSVLTLMHHGEVLFRSHLCGVLEASCVCMLSSSDGLSSSTLSVGQHLLSLVPFTARAEPLDTSMAYHVCIQPS